MSRHVVKLPDLGEGTVSSEIVSWRVNVGDFVTEDQPIVEMSTDKAVIEMPSPVSGRVVALGGQPGDLIAVGAELIVLESNRGDNVNDPGTLSVGPIQTTESTHGSAVNAAHANVPQDQRGLTASPSPGTVPHTQERRVLTSPAIRARAKRLGIDLARIAGSGRGGRIQREDFEAALQDRQLGSASARTGSENHGTIRTGVEEIRILGVRRVSAQRVADSKRNIPHFSYVEEVDLTELDRLRIHLNSRLPKGAPAYTYLPFLAMALARVFEEFPKCNARYDAERNVLIRHDGVHIGVATQTRDGLKVPVVRHAESMSLKALAAEIRRLSQAARDGTASRNELGGSTVTITSLGKFGGIMSTPIINAPEVSIIGINKAVQRPVIMDGQVTARLMMNLSCSFDHRFIDGFDAAETIQALKSKLEHPATICLRD